MAGALAIIGAYQRYCPKIASCRFEPSCSAYGAPASSARRRTIFGRLGPEDVVPVD